MSIKHLDLFRKVQTDISYQTFTGGIFSMLSLIVTCLILISLEFIYFYKKYNIFKIKKFIEICL